jgi:hypothetical protein
MRFAKKERGKMDEFHFGMEWHFYVCSVAWPMHSGKIKYAIFFFNIFKIEVWNEQSIG